MSNPFITHPTASHFLEGATLGFFAMYNGTVAVTEAITETDWLRLTGQHGAIFVLAVVGLAFWAKSIRDEKTRAKEDESRERRHKETLDAGEVHFNRLIDMNAKNASDLKDVSLASVAAQINATNAIENLTKELAGRPCGVNKFPAEGS
jgi:hypothetical protein